VQDVSSRVVSSRTLSSNCWSVLRTISSIQHCVDVTRDNPSVLTSDTVECFASCSGVKLYVSVRSLSETIGYIVEFVVCRKYEQQFALHTVFVLYLFVDC